MDNILKIFSQVAEKEGLKIGTLERSLGASKGVISRAINNNTDVQSKWLQALIEKYPYYNYQKMLKGDFSTIEYQPEEEQHEQANIKDQDKASLQAFHADLKQDLAALSEGMAHNFKVVSDGIFTTIRGQQKILGFIEGLNAEEISKATSKLDQLLKEISK